MTAFDAFPYIWLAGVAIMVIVNVAWAINDLKKGSARLSWYGSRASREEEPFEFWLAIVGKLAALPIGMFMFWFGLSFVGVG